VHPQRDCPANVGCEASVTVHPTTTPYGSLRIGPELDPPERRGPTGVVLGQPGHDRIAGGLVAAAARVDRIAEPPPREDRRRRRAVAPSGPSLRSFLR
jgi:hypothetical protein